MASSSQSRANINNSSIASQEDIEDVNDPIYKQLGNVPLSLLDHPERYFVEGVLRYTSVATMEKGRMFGELALIDKKPRAATILAQRHSEFAVLSEEDYNHILLSL